jgi:HEAT repeat protein
LAGFLAIGAAAALALVLVLRGGLKPADSPRAPDRASNPAVPAGPLDARTKSTGTTAPNDAAQQATAQLILRLEDSSLSLNERKQAVAALAKIGSPEAMAALKKTLGRSDSPAELRRSIVEAVGQTSGAENLDLLLGMLKDSDPDVARAAVRGLGKQDQPEAATALSRLVTSPDASADLRCEAALVLGGIGEPWVLDPLSQAARESDDEEVVKAAVDSIGGLDFSGTKDFFQDFLQSGQVSTDLRVAAVEALAQAQGDPTSFLAGLAAKDADPEVRAAAAWAMSATETTGNSGPDLLAMLQNESDPDVRLRLYQALRNQQDFDVNAALADVQTEKDPSARIAGLDLIAKLLRDSSSATLQTFFNSTGVPELKQIVLTSDSLDDRQAAILALTRARTPQAVAALSDLAGQMQSQQAGQSGGAAAGGGNGPPGPKRH